MSNSNNIEKEITRIRALNLNLTSALAEEMAANFKLEFVRHALNEKLEHVESFDHVTLFYFIDMLDEYLGNDSEHKQHLNNLRDLKSKLEEIFKKDD